MANSAATIGNLDFLSQLDGVKLNENPGLKFGSTGEQPTICAVTGKVNYARPIMIEDFRFLASIAKGMPKFTIPSPSMLHMRGGRAGIAREAYPELDAFWMDAVLAYRAAIAAFTDAGCTYLQVDDVAFSYLCDPRFREGCRENGDDTDTLPRTYADTINRALEGRPLGMTITMHTCRGNSEAGFVGPQFCLASP
jgi:5-methyltetrahydropteroyltriglutamate--homocysteine methyltransferase